MIQYLPYLLFPMANVSVINVSLVNAWTPWESSSSFHSVSLRAAAYCSVNEPPANGGVINRTRLRPGSKLFYYCNRGYRLVGSSNATCRLHPNGLFQWDTAPPLCQGEHKYMCVCPVCLYIYIHLSTHTHIHVCMQTHTHMVLEQLYQLDPQASSQRWFVCREHWGEELTHP